MDESYVYNSDDQSLFSDSSSADDSQSNGIPNKDELNLRQPEGHECSLCLDTHHLHDIALSTFQCRDGSRVCPHVFCVDIHKVALIGGAKTCPSCRKTGIIVRHDIFPTPASHRYFQDFLQQDQGHECTICEEVHHLHDMALVTIQHDDISQQRCRHVFCYRNLLQQRIEGNVFRCPSCGQIGHVVHHGIVRRIPQ